MRITGTLHSIGHHQILTDGNPDDDETIEDRLERFTGILITANEATLRAASNLLCATVDIYPHPVNELIKGECTPDNYAHAMARLAHAEASSPTADHLAREVRSSQALLVINEGLRTMVDGYGNDARELREEVKRLRRVLHKHDISADASGEEFDGMSEGAANRQGVRRQCMPIVRNTVPLPTPPISGGHQPGLATPATLENIREVRSSQALIARVKELEQAAKARADADAEDERKRQQYTDERETVWRKYLDLRKQVRIATAAERPNDEVDALMAEALELGRKYDFDVDRMDLADAKKSIVTLEAKHTALLAKQAEQERLLSIYRTKYHEADRALREVTNTLARCVPPDFGVVPATNFSDETRENAWSQWWERNTRAVKDDDASAGD